MKNSFVVCCGIAIRWPLYAAAFLVPIFFLAVTPYPVDLNKQALTTALVGIATVAWIARALAVGKLEYPKSKAVALAGAAAAFATVSALFSGARHAGLLGVTGAEPGTALATATFAAALFLGSGEFREKGDARRIVSALLAGAGAIALHTLLQVMGIRLPWAFADAAGFNPIGLPNALAIYFAFSFALSFAVAQYAVREGRAVRVACAILAALSFAGAVLVGYWPAFLGMIGAVLLFAWIDRRGKTDRQTKRDFVPVAAIGLSVLMIAISLGIIPVTMMRMDVPSELVPAVSASWHIGMGAAGEGVRGFVLGSGPATYRYEYAKYRDAGLNGTGLWAIPFGQGANAVMTHFVEWGPLGTILFIALLLAIAGEAVRAARSRREVDIGIMAIQGGLIVILLALVLYPQNFTLYFLLFLSAAAVIGPQAAHKDVSCKAFGWSLGLMLALLVVFGASYANARRYVAGAIFARGIDMANASPDIEQAIPYLAHGADLDPENSAYLQVLGSALFARANAYAAGVVGTATDADRARITAAIAAAITAADRAAAANPRDAGAWTNLAQAYVRAMAIDANAASGAFAAYARAAALDPWSPAIPLGLGQAHAANAARVPKEKRAAEESAAIAAFEASIALKGGYAPARLALIDMLDRAGRSAEAIARAEALRADAAGDAGTLFQLGALQYGAGRFEGARSALGDAVRVAPDYANALYFLGLVLDKLDDRAGAMVLFQKVLKLNPGNEDIAAVIANMRAGRPAAGGSSAAPVPATEEKAVSMPKPR